MPIETVEGVVLDHVAHAVHRWQDGWNRYAVDFGAEWVSGGPGPGFAPGQLRFANDARLELLMPNDTERNDFLERFLRSGGPGPHHLTFKVADIGAAIEQARRGGWEPIGIDLSNPHWMEAFIHPKEATGVVVQLAQSPPHDEPPSPVPDDYPRTRRVLGDGTGVPVAPASLLRVTHFVADVAQAMALFGDLLGGEMKDSGRGAGFRWVDLRWGAPTDLRVVGPDGAGSPRELLDWLEGRPGRIHHLGLVAEDPEGLADSRPASPDEIASRIGRGSSRRRVIEPEANEGLRLLVDPSAG